MKRVFWFSLQLLSETFLILWRNQRDAVMNVHISVAMLSSCYSCQAVIKTWIFSDRFSKNIQILIFMKIYRVGDELFRADGRTDMTAIIIPFFTVCISHSFGCLLNTLGHNCANFNITVLCDVMPCSFVTSHQRFGEKSYWYLQGRRLRCLFDVCVTVCPWYNNINSQLHATITILLILDFKLPPCSICNMFPFG